MDLLKRTTPYAHELLLAALLLTLLLTFHLLDPDFMSPANQQSQFFNVWDLALLSLPMTLIIITAGIDLSVGSTMALAAVTFGLLFSAHCPTPLAAAAALLTGLLCGLLNAFFITKIHVHPLIVTLATYSAFRGLAEGLALALAPALHLPSVYGNFPDSFQYLGKHAFLAGPDPANPPAYALSLAGYLFLILAIFLALLLAKTPFGRALYAIGHNEKAATYSGLKVTRIKCLLYTLSGLIAALAALNSAAFNNNAQASLGNGIELDVITAVVLGGTSIFGGRGRILGTLLGVALIHETREFVSYHFNQNELIRVVLGALLLLAVATNALFKSEPRKSEPRP